MAWGKVDDKLHSHVKWRRASKGARALWTTALSWCSDHPSDGNVPRDVLGMLDGTKKEADDLVRVGLWVTTGDGYRFHEWGERNPDAASSKEARKGKSAGGKRGNHTRWHEARGVKVPDCEWCASDDRSHMRSDRRVASESSRTRTRTHSDSDSQSARGSYVTRDDEPPQLETSIPRHVLPASWAPTTAHQAYAMERGADINHELRQFRAHCRSQRKTSLDWDAEFEKWLGNARTQTAGAPRSSDRQGEILRAEMAAALVHDAMTETKEITA